MLRTAILAAAAATLVSTSVEGQAPPVARQDYALTNVRIVAAPGRVIQRGTVLVREGRIAAVGASVSVPAGVNQIDLAGHTVYPGLIDAAITTGVPSTNRTPAGAQAAAPAGGRGAGRGGGGAAPGGRGAGAPVVAAPAAPTAPVIFPEVDSGAEAAELFAPTGEQLAALRNGGVTTVGLVFDGGLFPGRVGAALTGGHDESKLALKSTVAQQVSFGTRRGGYPNTGIGAVAFVKQSILDAQYEHRVERAAQAGASVQRPEPDPFRSAIVPAASGEIPTWFMASNERQLVRVSEIAAELGLQKWVVVGATEGWRVIPNLRGASAVVSLNWPNPNNVTGSAFRAPVNMLLAGGPVMQGPDTVIMTQVRTNAAQLMRAGIPVAFASLGGESGSNYRDRIAQTVEAGMSHDDALRASTIGAAQFLGIDTQVGTIENGKLANLVVVEGNNLFARNATVKHVFVEGRHYPLGGEQSPSELEVTGSESFFLNGFRGFNR